MKKELIKGLEDTLEYMKEESPNWLVIAQNLAADLNQILADLDDMGEADHLND
jgi:hypothetical protein